MSLRRTLLAKHWRGELPLAVAFWVNYVGIGLILVWFSDWYGKTAPIDYPVDAARATLILMFLLSCVVYPWQAIGLWRAVANDINEKTRSVWKQICRTLVVINAVGLALTIVFSLGTISSLLSLSTGENRYTNYEVKLNASGQYVCVVGPMGFGISRKLEEFLRLPSPIAGIVLNSEGGRVYEGRRIGELASEYALDTYALGRCYSACTVAFLGGRRRYIVEGAVFGFHSYQTSEFFLPGSGSPDAEREQDLKLFEEKGVDRRFVEDLFEYKSPEFWYPPNNDLIGFGYAHQFLADHGICG